MGVIIWNGRSSKDIGVVVEHLPSYEIPERDYEITHVPGRNGDVVIDKGSYKNVSRTYSIAALNEHRSFPELTNPISEWLNSAPGYARLEDSYEPEYFRMAMYRSAMTFSNVVGHATKGKITFDCKPQRFLKIGEVGIEIPPSIFDGSNSFQIQNPTGFVALPKITINGNAGVHVRVIPEDTNLPWYEFWIDRPGGNIVIDSDLQDAYSGYTNKNSAVTFADDDAAFPRLHPGVTWFSVTKYGTTGELNSIEVIPRWWTI